MARPWREVRRRMSPEDEARSKRGIATELKKLRTGRLITQTQLSTALRMNQGAISKLEQRSDMYLSTLRNYVEALGGQLEVKAVFPNREIVLENNGPGKPKKKASSVRARNSRAA
jgi:transcriptional regulator with XRE-family HTH domain